jgi:hypothetical protein
VALAAVVLAVAAIASRTTTQAGIATAGHLATEACRAGVLNRLKAPATARWVNLTAERRKPADGPDWYLVTGQVDSQNGFSALIRGDFRCEVQYAGAWTVTNIQFASD